jgi:hypothetical protein
MSFSLAKYCSPKFRRAIIKSIAQRTKIVRLNLVEPFNKVFLKYQKLFA